MLRITIRILRQICVVMSYTLTKYTPTCLKITYNLMLRFCFFNAYKFKACLNIDQLWGKVKTIIPNLKYIYGHTIHQWACTHHSRLSRLTINHVPPMRKWACIHRFRLIECLVLYLQTFLSNLLSLLSLLI